jgi:hypothetical protein
MPVDAAKNVPHFWICPALKPERQAKHETREPAPIQFELFPW